MRLTPIAVSALALMAAACTGETETSTTAIAPGASGTSAPAATAAERAPVGATNTVNLQNGQGQAAGTITVRQGPQGVLLRVEATGLTPGWHGIHFHAIGTCEGPGFQSSGGHVHAGSGQPVHGILNEGQDDSGDLPNIYADAQGRAFAELFTPWVRLADSGPGEHLLDTDGSAIVIHANPDDHSSQPIGGAGDRVACGVIQAAA